MSDQTRADWQKPKIFVSKRPGDERYQPGTKANPCASIQTAVDNAPPGSVINVEQGIYKERIQIGKSNLVVQTDAENPAVIEPGGKTAGRGTAGFSVGSNIYDVAIKNFEVRKFSGLEAGIKVEGKNISNIIIAGNNLHGAQSTEAIRIYGRGASESETVKDVQILSNKVHDLKLGQLEAIPINGNVKDFKIVGNAGYRLDNIFIDVIGGEGKSPNPALDKARGVVEFNYASEISTKTNSAYNYSRSAPGIYIDGGSDVQIRYNYITAADFGFSVGSEHRGINATKINTYGNIVENAHLDWMTRGGEIRRPGGASHSTAFDNILIGNGRLETQQNVDLKTFPVANNPVYSSLDKLAKMPKPIVDALKQYNRN